MNDKHSIGVVLTAYNDIRTISVSLNSIAVQDSAPDCVLLVDDASSDGTVEELRRYAQDHPNVLVIENETNIGVARSRNKALKHLDTDYVLFVDSDDVLKSSALRIYRSMLQDDRADAELDVVYSRAIAFDERVSRSVGVVDHDLTAGVRTGLEMLDLLAHAQVHAYLWNKLIRRSLLVGLSFPVMSSQSDLALLPLVFGRASRVAVTDAVTYEYRLRDGSITNSKAQTSENVLACLRSFELAYGEALQRKPPTFTAVWLGLRAVHAAIAADEPVGSLRSSLRISTPWPVLVKIASKNRRLGVMALLATRLGRLYDSLVRVSRAFRSRKAR